LRRKSLHGWVYQFVCDRALRKRDFAECRWPVTTWPWLVQT